MVPTGKEILFSGTFPGQNYHFPGRFKNNKSRFGKKSIPNLSNV